MVTSVCTPHASSAITVEVSTRTPYQAPAVASGPADYPVCPAVGFALKTRLAEMGLSLIPHKFVVHCFNVWHEDHGWIGFLWANPEGYSVETGRGQVSDHGMFWDAITALTDSLPKRGGKR